MSAPRVRASRAVRLRPRALALGAALTVAHVAAQSAAFLAPRPMWAQGPQRDGSAHARYLALNVAIGTTAAMARAIVTGAPMRPALTKGLVGGSLMSAGMELIGTESAATRLAGLQLTAVGASVSRNVDDGVAMLSDITLPFYPFYVRVRPGASSPVTARLSLMSAARLATVLSRGERPRVDWGATLATGAPVLRSPRWRLRSAACAAACVSELEGAFAQHNAGVIVYSASAGTDYDLRRSLAHESVHLAQNTRDALLDAMPASDAVLARLGRPGRQLSRFLVVDMLLPLRLIDEGEARMRGARRRDSWYEVEARAFAPGGQLHY